MVTLAEVAQHAGVSASTVSYVLSGKRSISATTRQRVEQSIRELGYHPNAGARALASSKSNIIALMVPLRTDMYVPVMMEIAIAVATTARTHGYDVLLLTGEEGPDAVRRVTGSGLADAMILMDVELDDERLPLLRGTDQPSVLIGLPADTSGLTCVDLDFKATGALCVEHLGDARPPGHRRHRRGPRGLRAAHRLRRAHPRRTPLPGTGVGHRRAAPAVRGRLRRHGRHPRPDPRRAPGHHRLRRAERAGRRAAARLLRQQGRAVPEDVSVVAVCPDQVAVQASVRLTSVAIPAQEMGRHAVERLVAKLDGRGTDEVVLIAPELTVRASTGPAPSGS